VAYVRESLTTYTRPPNTGQGFAQPHVAAVELIIVRSLQNKHSETCWDNKSWLVILRRNPYKINAILVVHQRERSVVEALYTGSGFWQSVE
jgi:hypothetical protein